MQYKTKQIDNVGNEEAVEKGIAEIVWYWVPPLASQGFITYLYGGKIELHCVNELEIKNEYDCGKHFIPKSLKNCAIPPFR